MKKARPESRIKVATIKLGNKRMQKMNLVWLHQGRQKRQKVTALHALAETRTPALSMATINSTPELLTLLRIHGISKTYVVSILRLSTDNFDACVPPLTLCFTTRPIIDNGETSRSCALMHDLRKRALLESGKTQSRKAQSRQSSAANSRGNSANNSRTVSRAASRQPSDDEDGYISEATVLRYLQNCLSHECFDITVASYMICPSDIKYRSTFSGDEALSIEDIEPSSEYWKRDLVEVINQILDYKKSSVTIYERVLSAYNYLLMTHFAQNVILEKWDDLISALLRCIRLESSVKQTNLALRGTLPFLCALIKALRTMQHWP